MSVTYNGPNCKCGGFGRTWYNWRKHWRVWGAIHICPAGRSLDLIGQAHETTQGTAIKPSAFREMMDDEISKGTVANKDWPSNNVVVEPFKYLTSGGGFVLPTDITFMSIPRKPMSKPKWRARQTSATRTKWDFSFRKPR